MKKNNTIITFEIEEQETPNFSKILELSGMVDSYDDDYPLELELDVSYNYYYDKGRTYGEPENCYPPEFELELEKVIVNKHDIGELLTDKQWEQLTELTCYDFHDNKHDMEYFI